MTAAVQSTAIADLASTLKQIDMTLLRALLQRLPPGESVVRLLNEQLSQAIRRTPRTVQSSLKRLAQAGLIAREACRSQGKSVAIGTEVTWPLSHAAQLGCSAIQAVDELAAAVTAGTRRPTKAKRRPVDPTQPTARYPFRELRAPHRVAHLPATVQAAQPDCEAFVEFLKRGFGERSTAFTMELLGLRRKMTDGTRGAPQPNLTIPLLGSWLEAWRWNAHLRYCMPNQLNIAEAVFKVVDDDHPLLLVDDVRHAALSRLPAGSAVVETSPGNFQVSVFAPRDLRPQERLFVQRALIEQLGGDAAANSSRQLRRFPGSVNNKDDVDCAHVARLHQVDTAPHFDHATLNHLLNEGFVLSMGGSSTVQLSVDPANPDQPQPAKPSAGLDNTRSGQDMRWVMRRLARGESESVVRGDLERAAMARGKSRSNGTGRYGYAAATIAKAKTYLATRGSLPRPAATANGPCTH